ncbi:MAG: 30S ribosomal protein S6 [Candidatus Cloacimonetes bacterium]|nr:30S ribosomal protein S6 [Candidatus Cloacimonadota bacterium]
MNKYESMIVISSQLPESDAAQENLKVTALIKELGGEMIETDEWGKRILSYEIQKMKDAYYFINYFTLPAEKVSELDRYYRLDEYIIRHNIIRK